MSRRTPPTEAPAPSAPSADPPPVSDDRIRDWSAVLSTADRACCCTARPVVTVVLPLTEQHPDPIDLLLCGHHYRVARESLTAADAMVFDATGGLVTTERWLVA